MYYNYIENINTEKLKVGAVMEILETAYKDLLYTTLAISLHYAIYISTHLIFVKSV